MDNKNTGDAYTIASEVLTKITLDLRSAIQQASDANSRQYAFALVHLSRDLAQTLADGIWTSPQAAGQQALELVRTRIKRDPQSVPDWLRTIAPNWSTT